MVSWSPDHDHERPRPSPLHRQHHHRHSNHEPDGKLHRQTHRHAVGAAARGCGVRAGRLPKEGWHSPDSLDVTTRCQSRPEVPVSFFIYIFFYRRLAHALALARSFGTLPTMTRAGSTTAPTLGTTDRPMPITARSRIHTSSRLPTPAASKRCQAFAKRCYGLRVARQMPDARHPNLAVPRWLQRTV